MVLLIVMLCSASDSSSAITDLNAEREIVARTCSSCHMIDYYHARPRSRKAWELTVANMHGYARNSEHPFTETDAASILEYMASFFNEDSKLDPIEHFAETPEPSPLLEERLITVPMPPLATPSHLIKPDVPPAIRELMEHPPWKPSHTVKRTAEASGYLAVLCILALLASGHARRRLGHSFRQLHITAALGLFSGLATHAIIYLAQYGNPPVLWYWFGIVSFITLVLAQVQGLIRKRFGPIFLRIHVTAGYCGLTLAILHWVWAWL